VQRNARQKIEPEEEERARESTIDTERIKVKD